MFGFKQAVLQKRKQALCIPQGKRGEEIMDVVNHPTHYTMGEIEVIDYIKDKLSPEELRGYIKGNVLKYISREAHKNGDEDLKKANWYLNHYIEFLERGKK